MTDTEFVTLVHKMRTAQKAYFKNRLNRDLQESKDLEKQVDYETSKRVIAYSEPKEATGKLF